MIPRLVRDLFSESVEELVIDDGRSASEIGMLIYGMAPELQGRIKVHKGTDSVFRHYNIEEQLDRAFRRKIWLENGAYLVIRELWIWR